MALSGLWAGGAGAGCEAKGSSPHSSAGTSCRWGWGWGSAWPPKKSTGSTAWPAPPSGWAEGAGRSFQNCGVESNCAHDEDESSGPATKALPCWPPSAPEASCAAGGCSQPKRSEEESKPV